MWAFATPGEKLSKLKKRVKIYYCDFISVLQSPDAPWKDWSFIPFSLLSKDSTMAASRSLSCSLSSSGTLSDRDVSHVICIISTIMLCARSAASLYFLYYLLFWLPLDCELDSWLDGLLDDFLCSCLFFSSLGFLLGGALTTAKSSSAIAEIQDVKLRWHRTLTWITKIQLHLSSLFCKM